jgi:hypothetical protein
MSFIFALLHKAVNFYLLIYLLIDQLYLIPVQFQMIASIKNGFQPICMRYCGPPSQVLPLLASPSYIK